jgi:hypothetical protein
MPKHYDVDLIKTIHVVVEDDVAEPELAAVDQAAQEFWDYLHNTGVFTLLESDFFATDKNDVYPVEPCDCGREADGKE